MKCSVQKIAIELHMSRNTVSKALNGRPGVSEATRKLICEKANEMNYRSFLLEQEDTKATEESILFLTKATIHGEFWLTVMKGLEDVLKKNHYNLILGVMNDDDMLSGHLPSQIYTPDVRGVVMVEICDEEICQKVIQLGLPTVSVDAPRYYETLSASMDIVTMENKRVIQQLVHNLIAQGKKSFAFAGDLSSANVSAGFQERFDALCKALSEHEIAIDRQRSLIDESNQQFMNFSYLISRFENMKKLPDVYICGNDWTAIQMMHAIQYCGYSIPTDVSILGFDNITESASTVPALSTVNTPKELLGYAAANCVLDHIANPQRPNVLIQYATQLIQRDSLDCVKK